MKNDFKSALMLSCHNEKHLKKIPQLESECIMLNLEDGVSKEQKPIALKLCGEYLDKYRDEDKMFVVRVNPFDEGGVEEIEYLNRFKPDAIRIPKIRSKNDVQKALYILDKDIELHLSIETASAWKNLLELKVDERVRCFYLGILDLFADMKLSQGLIDIDNPTMHYMLSHFLINCKVIGVKPVSFVYQNHEDLDGFSKWVELEKTMGFDAKGCISPKQVKIANEVFTTEEEELIKAKKIVELFEANREKGVTGFVSDEYGFIDEPIYKGALAVLKR